MGSARRFDISKGSPVFFVRGKKMKKNREQTKLTYRGGEKTGP